MSDYDCIILGAGAAGLFAAMRAGQRGRRVLLIDHARKAGEKIRISGGGRCNFTNLNASPAQYLSQNPHFCVSALSRFTQHDFIALVKRRGIAFHEKTLGQLFCDGPSQQIIDLLLDGCREAGVELRLNTRVGQVGKSERGFTVALTDETTGRTLTPNARTLIVACGGLSIPKMGATGLGYQIARQFGLKIIPTTPALVPFTLAESELASLKSLSGIALDSTVSFGNTSFREGLLFTHRGLSGPSILQISSYWQPGQPVRIDLAPGRNAEALLKQARTEHSKQETATPLGQILPKRLAQLLAQKHGNNRKLAEISNRDLTALANAINRWDVTPNGTEGYRTAEVTLGGVDTAGLSSRTMESLTVPGLFFIGEVVDVTGHLGGYNFQWAWSSAHAAAEAL